MNRKILRPFRAILLCIPLVLPAMLSAQAQDEDDPMGDDIVMLNPFEVISSEDTGYMANATLAGTRVRTELKDIGSAISVVTDQFLNDTGSRNSEDLLVYTASTEVGGNAGNFTGAGNGAVIDNTANRLRPQNNTRVRGLAAADNTRDFFLTDIPWDSYIVDRVDLQRGPNSILFGIGSPAGIVNSSITGATYEDAYELTLRVGSFGSVRGVLDLNKVVLSNELAARVTLLHDHTKYRQDPAYNRDKRAFVAFRYEPEFMKIGSSNTTIKIGYETGKVDANRPRTTPPIDNISPWFNNLDKMTYSAQTIAQTSQALIQALGPNAGAINQTVLDANGNNVSNTGPGGTYQPWVSNSAGRIYDNSVAVFADENSSNQSGYFQASRITNRGEFLPTDALQQSAWHVYRGIQGFDVYSGYANLPNNELGVYKTKSLMDPTIFDFYNLLLDGPNKKEWQDFNALNISLAQTYFSNKLGLEVSYDHQNYEEGQTNMLSGFAQAITIDVMSVLPDGTPNPNVGRPMVASDSFANNWNRTERHAFRVTGFGELDFRDSDSKLLSNFVGRHLFTMLYSKDKNATEGNQWTRYVATEDYPMSYNQTIKATQRQIATISYLGDSLADRTSAAGAHIPRINAYQLPTSGTINQFITQLRPDVTLPPQEIEDPNDPGVMITNPAYQPFVDNEANYIGWTQTPINLLSSDRGDKDQLYTGANKGRDEVSSKALVWQGFLLNGTIVPTFGYREDTARNFDAGNVPTVAGDDNALVNDPGWTVPTEASSVVSGISRSWSIVAHSPEFINRNLPWGTQISLFYNDSENFQPLANRRNVFNLPIASPSGKTKDYGFSVSTLDGKLSLKVNRYETNVTNATLPGVPAGQYLIGAGEAWGLMFALEADRGINNYATNYALDGNGNLIDPNIPDLRYQPAPGQTVAQAYAEQEAALSAFLGNPPSQDIITGWNINGGDWDGYDPAVDGWITNNFQVNNIAVTGDTFSKGTEIEIVAQPTPNWNVSINASKTSAVRLNLAESYAQWVEARHEFYQGPAGNLRFWNGGYAPTETLRGKFEREFWGSYTLFRLQENADVPELRPWRFNLVTNYAFSEGPMKGLNFGAGYRWQDQVVIGYPVDNGTFQLDNPYMGPAETNVDCWIGYEKTIGDKYQWRVQLNIRNAFGDDELIPITKQPDGSPAAFRIPEPTTWFLTNTISF